MRQAVLVSAVRTPVGKKGGVFKNMVRQELVTPVVQEAIRRANQLQAEPVPGQMLLIPVL